MSFQIKCENSHNMDSNVTHPSQCHKPGIGCTFKFWHIGNACKQRYSSHRQTCIDCADRVVRIENACNQHEQPELLLGPSALPNFVCLHAAPQHIQNTVLRNSALWNVWGCSPAQEFRTLQLSELQFKHQPVKTPTKHHFPQWQSRTNLYLYHSSFDQHTGWLSDFQTTIQLPGNWVWNNKQWAPTHLMHESKKKRTSWKTIT